MFQCFLHFHYVWCVLRRSLSRAPIPVDSELYFSLELRRNVFLWQGKHQTAVAKFKQALQHDFNQLEALFNICIQYRKLGNLEAEIQGLKLLKQVKRLNQMLMWFSSKPKLVCSFCVESRMAPSIGFAFLQYSILTSRQIRVLRYVDCWRNFT